MQRALKRKLLLGTVASLLVVGTLTAGSAAAANRVAFFDMLPSRNAVTGALVCTGIPNAVAHVKVASTGPVEAMVVDVSGLPANTVFDFFVIQVPTAPFGVSWYQGDIETGASGTGHASFIGRFNIETFAISPGAAAPPQVFTDQPFPDATMGVAFAPIQMYHLGLWFNSPADAVKAGCPGTTTPFNGEHNAGVQVLNTAQFPAQQGPLRQVTP
jgi:hypothetical protein